MSCSIGAAVPWLTLVWSMSLTNVDWRRCLNLVRIDAVAVVVTSEKSSLRYGAEMGELALNKVGNQRLGDAIPPLTVVLICITCPTTPVFERASQGPHPPTNVDALL